MSDPVIGVPVIVGLVEVYKRLGLPARWAPAVALVVGVLMALSSTAGGLGAPGLVAAFWYGVMLGLAAVGLYEVSGRSVRREA